MLECVVNLSEGRDEATVAAIGAAAGAALLDVHVDAHHNRAVLTVAGSDTEGAARAVVAEAVKRIDLSRHSGVHPRLGAADVVPFVPLGSSNMAAAVAARDRTAAWVADELGVPVFLYGPERTLPDVRRRAFAGLAPDFGPSSPHPTAGALCAGARPVLVAYNVWLQEGSGVDVAKAIAADLRRLRAPAVLTLGLDVGGRAQVSMNLVDPFTYGPADAYDDVAGRAGVRRAELVGLVPAEVLSAVSPERWPELGLGLSRTIEARLQAAPR